jgi:hypothetical protein
MLGADRHTIGDTSLHIAVTSLTAKRWSAAGYQMQRWLQPEVKPKLGAVCSSFRGAELRTSLAP